MRMPQLRARLLTHGPQVLEGEEAAIAAVNGHAQGHVEWLPGMRGAHVIEHEGQVRVLVQRELPAAAGEAPEGPVSPAGDLLPRLSFELRNTLDADGEAIDRLGERAGASRHGHLPKPGQQLLRAPGERPLRRAQQELRLLPQLAAPRGGGRRRRYW